MSGRLDQSLDSIIDSQKKAKRDGQRRGRKPGKTARAAPVGGVKKAVKPVKSAVKPSGAVPVPMQPSKIVISGLPYDVTEQQIKEYFHQSIGSVKRVTLQYNQNGQSRGIADVIFSKPGLAAKAAKELNGVRIDERPMKIDVVVDAHSLIQQAKAKPLSERVGANTKAQPKSATKAVARDAAKGRKAAKPKGKSTRSKPKTTEELDAEMTDYFNSNNANAAAPAAATNSAAVAGGDDNMEEIS